MGLRTTTRTPIPSIHTESPCESELPSTSLSVGGILKSTLYLQPDAAISGKMAPALTEPLSPTNKLSSSAASASPRPTAASSPLQTNNNSNNNNNNNTQTNNNNNDSNIESVSDNSNLQTSSNHNSSGSDKDKIVEGKPVPVTTAPIAVAPQPPPSVASAKGAFQLAFEQSVGVRKTPTPTPSTVVNGGETLSANSIQMGPMCDSKLSQPPALGPNSSPLIKSKITQIDPETAAKIITSQFEDFPSDIEEAITAEICLRQKLKSTEEQEQPQQEQQEAQTAKVEEDKVSYSKLGEHLFEEPKKPMEEEIIKSNDKSPQPVKTDDEIPVHEIASGEAKETISDDKLQSKNEEVLNKPQKLNIISVQELPPIKTDSTVTASEDDNIEERLKQLDGTDECPMPISQESGDHLPATPPRNSSAQVMTSQLTPTSTANIPNTPSLSSLTPLSTTSTLCGSSGSHAKEFKDTNSEIDHDIDDDLLQVLKGFDPNAAGTDICDLAGFLSEYGMNYEDVNPPTAKENPIKEVQLEIEKNQQTMQRKIDFLSRRLRKLQARYMSKQASEEIAGLFEWSARITKRKNSNVDHQQMTYAEERYHPVTTTTMRSVLKKIETAASSSQQVSPEKKIQSAASTGKVTEPAFTGPPSVEVVVPTFDEKITEEIAHVSGRLQAEMREVQSAIDSDATASSSGGESADEMVPYNNISQETLPIAKRAAWRYSRDRAAIASRWSWLVSQISDLEFKIRQHTELHQQLRQRKGKVILVDASSEAGNLGSAAAATGAASTGTGPNGYRGALPGATPSKMSGGFTTADETDLDAAIDGSNESSQGSCRTRAFQSSFYRKRKLFQTANVHTISKKAARPSTIKCGCQWPLHPCALCTGRSDPTAPRDLPDTMMKSQRVALLDPGFHPVLSFSEDISNSIFFEKISRDTDWQNRVARSTAKTVIRGALAAQRAAEKEEQRAVNATSGRITPSTPHNANTSSSSNNGGTTGKRKYTKRNHQDSQGGGSHSTTPLVANKVGKSSKKQHRQRNRSPDYVPYPRKQINNNHQTLSSHQSLHQNAEQSNHHQAHSSLNYQNSKNNKIRKLSSASTAAAATTATTIYNNHSGIHLSSNNILNPNNYQQHLNNQQHHSYNNELNFLHCDSLDGDSSTNGLMMGPSGRSRTSSPTHGSSHQKYERALERRSRTSYDIDNIVIPYSVAAATRVELLPYKEIPTPKWRIIDYDAEDITKNTTNSERTDKIKPVESTSLAANPEEETSKSTEKEESGKKEENIRGPSQLDDDEEGGEEDISDEAMILRHERALTEERRKFQTFLKFPYSTRSRANRRIDSRAESSGANTPDPTSPAPNTPSVGGDQESIPSPFAPSTPLTPLESIAETGETSSNPSALDNTTSIMSLLNSISKKQERRRTVSTKKEKEKDEHRRSSTPDPRDLIPPYEPLKFPIPNDLFDTMLKMMPDEYPPPQEDCPQSIKKPLTTTATKTTPTKANGFVDTNSSQLPPPTGVAQKIVCDPNKKLNNNKNALLTTLNNQKSIEHITGEEGNPEHEDADGQHFQDYYTSGAVAVNGESIKDGMGAPPPPPQLPLQPGMEFQPSFMCRNNLLGCSDTESLESENDGDDDPNDPEWKEEEKRK
ncbi:uncharacterized protein LOC129941381 [Eupeodes corollae]|uniref:uncharacterized protein LOC129941381 n=1 Tax=Eupeodes corollae TaxID=290404 RepID=UPI00248FA8A3|nr:uncharacterized protein LOC129941381 [Eupeodes corollae]